jgi:hypothetical protein
LRPFLVVFEADENPYLMAAGAILGERAFWSGDFKKFLTKT